MNPLETTLGLLIAAALFAVAGYFAWHQRHTLRLLRTDPDLAREQRRYLLKQCWRRLFGSVVLCLLALMLIGSLFLDYPQLSPVEAPQAAQEAAKQTTRFLVFYLMTMLLLLMVVLALAVLDFWATARFGVLQQKQLLQEHQEMLAAELEEHRHRQAEMN